MSLKLGLYLGYWGIGPQGDDALEAVQFAEGVGFESVWVAESYGSDVVSVLAWLAGQTEKIKLGAAIMQVPARPPAAAAMAGATIDKLSHGRFMFGFGPSGPVVSEGWYGVPYAKAWGRTREYVQIVREIVAREQKLDILPLVVDFARPSPALGWRNRECASFMDRARGSFDVVLMLAVLHHFLVTERVPLDDVLSLTAELTTSYVLLEFVAPEDPMFRHIARGRDHLHADLNTAVFERACKKHFEIVRSTRVGVGHRWLYWLRKRGTSS
jgi:hypothetical protein